MSCRCTGYSVRDTVGQTVTSVVGDDTGRSPFESALRALGPVSLYRFHDANFATNIQDYSGNGNHLVKQNATAARSSVPTRTTHPGGAYFPAVTYDDWATLGTEYKAAANGVLQDATAYTLVVSFRLIKSPSDDLGKIVSVGNEDAPPESNNSLITLQADPGSAHELDMETNAGTSDLQFLQTGDLEDGVNRLITVRADNASELWRMVTSKPGHEFLVEDSETFIGSNLIDFSRPIVMNAREETATGSATTLEMVVDQVAIFDSDIGATAEAELHSKWMTEVAGAGYYPSMMQYDGSTGYYGITTLTTAGNKSTAFLRFNTSTFTTSTGTMLFVNGPLGEQRIRLLMWNSDNANAALRNKVGMVVENSAGTTICLLISTNTFADGEDHLIFAAFDGDNGTAIFRIDGEDEDDTGHGTRVAPTTGTLDAGGSSDCWVGSITGSSSFWPGKIGMIGYRDAYLTNYDDFPTDPDALFAIDEKNWTEFGAQPLFWSHTGQMDSNKGSAGDMTLNGDVVMTEGGSP